jgi:hypothetical protein
MPNRAFSLAIAIVVSVTLSQVDEAAAYVPPSQFILKKIAVRKTDLKTARVRSTVVAWDGEKPTFTRFKEVISYHAATRTLRSVALHDVENVELYVEEKRGVALNPLELLLFDSQLKTLTDGMKAAKLPVRAEEELLRLGTEEERRSVETSSFARIGGAFAWVIGRKDKWDPQLWVEKDSFLPLRLIWNSEEGLTDVRMEKFRFSREVPYPRVVTGANKGGSVWMQAELAEFALNADLPELKKPASVMGFTDAGRSSPGALRDFIQRYYGTLR